MTVGKRLLTVIITVFVSMTLWASNAQACTFVLQFDGIETPLSVTTWGAQAYIMNYNPHLCSSSSAWVMILNYGHVSTEIAQVGYLKQTSWSTSTVYFFYEYGDTTQLFNPVMLAADNNGYGTSENFAVYNNTKTGYTLFNINNVTQQTSYLGWNAKSAQWFAETHSLEDQTVGGTSHPVTFQTVQHLYNGTWYNDNAANEKYNNASNGSGDWYSSNYFEVWDKRYS